jgi:hypothetical protein
MSEGTDSVFNIKSVCSNISYKSFKTQNSHPCKSLYFRGIPWFIVKDWFNMKRDIGSQRVWWFNA